MSSTKTNGNDDEDWRIFEILCEHDLKIDSSHDDHINQSFDVVTTLKTELAATNYKRERLLDELTEVRSTLNARNTECKALKTQISRQSVLIESLRSRILMTEQREKSNEAKAENAIRAMQEDKKSLEDRIRELTARIRSLESDLSFEESGRAQTSNRLQDLKKRLCLCMGIEICNENRTDISSDIIVAKATDIVDEVQRLRHKFTSTCDSLHSCESELLAARTEFCAEKQRLQQQIENYQLTNRNIELHSKQFENDLKSTRDHLAECQNERDALREELRDFELRCNRLQTTVDMYENDKTQFLHCLASMISLPEPCETMIKEKIRNIWNENQSLQSQVKHLRGEVCTEVSRYKDVVVATNTQLRLEESQKSSLEERLEKSNRELHRLRSEQMTLPEFLFRLSRILFLPEYGAPPEPGIETTMLSESLLEKIERLISRHNHHGSLDKHAWEHINCNSATPTLHPGYHSLKLRRERSCHDLPVKESTAMFNLQKQMRIMKEQLKKKDLLVEFLKRKIKLLEETLRGKCALQSDRDETLCRTRRTSKQADRTCAQLVEAKCHISELKAQLANAVEHKITALERARKIDELTNRNLELENENGRLMSQITTDKMRCRSAVDCSMEHKRRDDQIIHNLREDISMLQNQLTESNHKLSHLQTFRSSVIRLLHLKDISHYSLLQRLQALCHG